MWKVPYEQEEYIGLVKEVANFGGSGKSLQGANRVSCMRVDFVASGLDDAAKVK